MVRLRLSFIGLILMIFIIPIGFGYADNTRIEDFSILSEVTPGENVSVAITVFYDFSSNSKINPGIFSFEADDWIVDKILPASGSDTVVYTMEFPAPVEEGIHLYQANVWYIINNAWFFDGVDATYNFTIQIGDINGTEIVEYANISDFSAPKSVNISSPVKVNVTLDYSLVNETEYSVNIRDTQSEIISEEFLSISGSDQRTYNLTFTASDSPGEYIYTINVEHEFENSSIVSSESFSLLVNAPVEPDIPETPETPDTPDDPPEVDPPTDDIPETPDTPEDPPKSWSIPGFNLISIILGSFATYRYWIKKD